MTDNAIFNLGKSLATAIVDHSDAIPAAFANESDATYWAGYLAGGFCDASRLQHILTRFSAAMGSN